MRRLLVFLAGVLAVSAAVYLLLERDPIAPDEDDPDVDQAANVMHLQQVKVQHQEGDRVSWTLTAERARLDENRRISRLYDVHFEVYERAETGDGQAAAAATTAEGAPPVAMRGRARQAVMIGAQDAVVLVGDAVVQRGRRLQVQGSRLVYDRSERVLRAPLDARVTADGIVQTGRNLTYWLDERRMHMDAPLLQDGAPEPALIGPALRAGEGASGGAATE